MKINKKHVISLVLALAMVLSCMPGVALVAKAETASSYDRPEGRSIVVGYDEYVGDDWAAELLATLPTTATIGGAGEHAITWPTAAEIKEIVNPDEVGFYFIPGTVDGVANAVTVTIQVRNEVSLIYNGDFEDGITGWSGSSSKTDPDQSDNLVAGFARKSSTSGTQIIYQDDTYAGKLAADLNASGKGQYFLTVKAKLSGQATASVWFAPVCKAEEGGNSEYPYSNSDSAVALDTAWKNLSNTFTVDQDWAYFRTDIKMKYSGDYDSNGDGTADTVNCYLDDFKLIPLNVALAAEPATVTGIETAPVALGIVQNYDTYVGTDWQTELGLPSEVTVTTSDTENPTATVAVEWDYSALSEKLGTVGRYVLTGTLDKSTYPNPNNLTIQQVIYVREKTNLIYNGDFELGAKTGWTAVAGPTNIWATSSDVAEGKYAAVVKTSTSTGYKNNQQAYQAGSATDLTSNYAVKLATAVQEQGAGQYYVSAQTKDFVYSSGSTTETNHSDDLKVYIRVNTRATYNSTTQSSSTTLTPYTSEATLSLTEWVTTGGIVELDGEAEWVQTAIYLKSDTSYKNQYFLVDDIQLFPLRVELAETPALPIDGASVDLGNSLDMNFYITADALADVASAKIVHTYADGTTETQEKTVADIKADSDGSYITYSGIAAKEMGDSITVTLYDSEGAAIAVWMDSMVDYLARISDQIPANLYSDLLNYGAAAQKHFDYNATQLVNSSVTTSIRDITPTNNSNGPEEWTGSTLILESSILMEVFFAKDALTGTETATVIYTTHAGTPVSKEVSLVLDDYYDEWKVQIDGLAIADVSTVVTVTVGKLTVTDSMESYVARQLEKGETDDIYKAILAVGDSAKAYFASL